MLHRLFHIFKRAALNLHGTWREIRWKHAALILAVLSIFNGVSILYGWFQSVDVKAWWPVLLVWQFLIAYVYAVAFVFLVRDPALTRPVFLILYHAILGTLLLLHAYLYYALKVDWLAVNNGHARLDMLQKLVYSGVTGYAIYTLFLIGAALASYANRFNAGRR